MELSPEEVRVLGALIEKQITTPDYYPLTVNSLVAACNQSSNRNPVVHYDEPTVLDALTGLREQALARIVYSPANRAPKHRHVADEVLGLHAEPLAVLCVLMLRGPQTVGELRTRTERMHQFESLDEVEATLQWLARREQPLVTRLERQPGQKEARYAHLLGGPVDPSVGFDRDPESRGASGSAAERMRALEDEVAAARREVDGLRGEIAILRRDLDRLRESLGEG